MSNAAMTTKSGGKGPGGDSKGPGGDSKGPGGDSKGPGGGSKGSARGDRRGGGRHRGGVISVHRRQLWESNRRASEWFENGCPVKGLS